MLHLLLYIVLIGFPIYFLVSYSVSYILFIFNETVIELPNMLIVTSWITFHLQGFVKSLAPTYTCMFHLQSLAKSYHNLFGHHKARHKIYQQVPILNAHKLLLHPIFLCIILMHYYLFNPNKVILHSFSFVHLLEYLWLNM